MDFSVSFQPWPETMGRPRAGGEMGLKEQWQIQGANQDFLTLDLSTHTYMQMPYTLPPVPTSTSVESLSKLPALLTMFIKWMAVHAKGIRYLPSLWQNCSAWHFSFSNFSLFWEEKIKPKNVKKRGTETKVHFTKSLHNSGITMHYAGFCFTELQSNQQHEVQDNLTLTQWALQLPPQPVRSLWAHLALYPSNKIQILLYEASNEVSAWLHTAGTLITWSQMGSREYSSTKQYHIHAAKKKGIWNDCHNSAF